LDGVPRSIRVGRQFVAETLARWGVGTDERGAGRVEEVVLVASELLANAVRATSVTAELRIEAHWDHVVVEVRDDCAAPAVARTAAPGDTSGRGLAIVDALSERWGTSPADGPGKVVWSRMAVSSPSLMAVCPR
jgi:anti-sigma regulatory factor (Ser/Thr protein kinase)